MSERKIDPAERRILRLRAHADENPTARATWELAAAAYGSRPRNEATMPTGFDPSAVLLFEGMVEAAFLAAVCDGIFDDKERELFSRLVVFLGAGAIPKSLVFKLVAELEDLLARDGFAERVKAVCEKVHRPEYGKELLRVAILLAMASDDVSAREREILDEIARGLPVPSGVLDVLIEEVRAAVG